MKNFIKNIVGKNDSSKESSVNLDKDIVSMDFTKWINSILDKPLPSEVVAINFNLYEDENNKWSMEFVGASSFDVDDSDWACDEVFVTRENPLEWIQEASWEAILMDMSNEISEYLENGKYADKLKSYVGIGVGFVDGDIEILYENSK